MNDGYKLSVNALADGLAQLVEVQRVVSGQLPGALSGTRQSVTDYSFALTEEVHELARELRWKPWAQRRAVNYQRVVEEWTDILAFVGVLLLNTAAAVEVDARQLVQDVANEYAVTSKKNYEKIRTVRDDQQKRVQQD